ncbi:hypothetical protein IW18_17920 [Flavobacterium hibernum]|uniref:Uncharacterized protein n=1 Tax=Flavobacterium hibernum TaxID=37752 RepID=A0A0D0ESX5_9FLAO|nr:hypothetical protein IW18_17920 [Flavobacterium hibernum]OXA86478.1 hypothetical protein B0A73_14010 [Flavobacterium hibernum]
MEIGWRSIFDVISSPKFIFCIFIYILIRLITEIENYKNKSTKINSIIIDLKKFKTKKTLISERFFQKF